MTTGKSAREAWADYLFLTQELLKFARADNAEMVEMLLDQREALQKMIDANPDKTFAASPEGRKTLAAVRETDAAVTREMNRFINRGKQQQALEQTYAGGAAARPAGSFINQKG